MRFHLCTIFRTVWKRSVYRCARFCGILQLIIGKVFVEHGSALNETKNHVAINHRSIENFAWQYKNPCLHFNLDILVESWISRPHGKNSAYSCFFYNLQGSVFKTKLKLKKKMTYFILTELIDSTKVFLLCNILFKRSSIYLV